jgi:hypothetical protein
MRSLQKILSADGSQGWRKLQGYSWLSPAAATTADISWEDVCKRVLQEAIEHARHDDHQPPARGQSVRKRVLQGAIEPARHDDDHQPPARGQSGSACSQVLQSASSQATVEFGLDHWQAVVRTAGVETVHGLHDYLHRWQKEDDQVRVWCEKGAKKELAEVGGWLADYMNTIFLVAAGREDPESVYRVVDNKNYMGLAFLLLPTSVHERSPAALGDILECLCWHAFEHSRYCFILGLIWNTTNRAITASSQETIGSQPEESRAAAVGAPGPAPPPTPPPSQVRQSASSQEETIGSQPEKPWAASVGAPGPAPPPPPPPPGLGPPPRGQLNKESHPADANQPYGRQRWRWRAACLCGTVEVSAWGQGGEPQRPVGWPTKALDTCMVCWTTKSGKKQKLR